MFKKKGKANNQIEVADEDFYSDNDVEYVDISAGENKAQQADRELPAASVEVVPSPPPKQPHAELINELINNYFEYTHVKITSDDPTIGLLLIQKLDLRNQLSELKASIGEDIKKEVRKESDDRLIEVDERFQTAQALANEFESQRQKIITEMGNLHQRNIITYASEQSKKIEELKALIGLSKYIIIITTLTLFIILYQNLK